MYIEVIHYIIANNNRPHTHTHVACASADGYPTVCTVIYMCVVIYTERNQSSAAKPVCRLAELLYD